MSTLSRLPLFATLAALALATTGVVIGAGQASAASDPVRCEIATSSDHSTLAIEGVVHSDTALSGSYRFNVVSSGPSGSSNISQGGMFQATPNAPVSLGRVMLGSAGAVYDVNLAITANGSSFQCQDRIAAR